MTMLVYSHNDLGLSSWLDIFWSSASTSVSPTASPDMLALNDDDPLFEDEGDGAASSQLLDQDLSVDGAPVGNMGDVVQHIGSSAVTNTTTGETGSLIVIQINGQIVGYATMIELNPGDVLEISPWIGSDSATPYADLINGPTCFTRGTLIACQRGAVRIEDLRVGEQVWTRDNGLQPLRWIGQAEHAGTGRFAPVCFMKGALGNARVLRVSQQHRMLVGGWRAELLFGTPEVLVPALDLVNGDTIYLDPQPSVTYFHLLFDRHQIVTANGIASESFAPADTAIAALDHPARAELFALFPELRDGTNVPWSEAYPTLNPAEIAVLQSVTGPCLEKLEKYVKKPAGFGQNLHDQTCHS